MNEEFELTASHPTNQGKKFSSKAKSAREIETLRASLKRTHPEHLLTIHKKRTGEAQTLKPHHPLPAFVHEETVPVNNVGDGNVAGTGVGPSGEPGACGCKKKRLRQILGKGTDVWRRPTPRRGRRSPDG